MSEGIGYLGVEQTAAQLLGPWLALELRGSVGYQCAFAVAFGCGIATVLLRLPLRSAAVELDARRTTKSMPRCQDGLAGRPIRPLWTRILERDAWRPASVMFLLMFGTAGINTFMAAHALERGIGDSGLFFVASGLTLAVSRLTARRILRRRGTAWIMVPGITLVAFGQVGVWSCPNLPVLLIAGASCGLGMGAVQPTLNSLAVLAAGRERRGRANSTFFMAMDLSQAVGAVTLGAVAGAAGTGSVFLVTAALCGASLTVYLGFKTRSLLP